MSANLIRPTTERATIAGPVGSLEALLEIPAGADGSRVAVICHPHPVHGGTMTNKVVHMLAKACNERGVPALRFNFRGVGASAGRYDEGEGETQDALAAIDWALQRWPGAALWAAGFSFGGRPGPFFGAAAVSVVVEPAVGTATFALASILVRATTAAVFSSIFCSSDMG